MLALSRALGETAPLILAGAVLGSFSAARSTSDLHRPVHRAAGHRLRLGAQAAGRVPGAAAAAIIVLLAITLFANAIAIYLRNRYERTW